jgi:DNA-binding CsgD family transcriptional regulator
MTSKMLKKIASGPAVGEASPVDRLSAREKEIFKLIGRGKGTRQVAEVLDLSTKTVDAHRANIKKKLDLKKGTELVQMAIKWMLSQKSEKPQG